MPDPKTLTDVAASAHLVGDARKAFKQAIAGLRTAIVTADRDGHGRNQIVKNAEGGLSRALVFDTLGAADLYGDVEAVLKKAAIPLSSFDADRHLILRGRDGQDGKVSFLIKWAMDDNDDRETSDKKDQELADKAIAALADAGYAGRPIRDGADIYIITREEK